jgi:hypothetical protein
MSSAVPSSAAPHMLPIELTLVVAATRSMGIGFAGTLPWTGLKQEMAYFARTTKRLPEHPLPVQSQVRPAHPIRELVR